ncbi:MAG: hypothetical protein F6K19_08520 [Cyanothece sp. SIO1E1]|nr:hypothetical protein [Cyanothece sp. SIO1E1]
MEHGFFFVGLAFITMHEMDAIRCKEWRIFPGLSLLSDYWGMIVFQLAHIPLFIWVFSAIYQGQEGFIKNFDLFLVVHLILHIIFLWHKKNEFKDWISWTIIIGAAVFGLIDYLIAF